MSVWDGSFSCSRQQVLVHARSLIEEGETFAFFTKLAFEAEATSIKDSVDSVILVGPVTNNLR